MMRIFPLIVKFMIAQDHVLYLILICVKSEQSQDLVTAHNLSPLGPFRKAPLNHPSQATLQVLFT